MNTKRLYMALAACFFILGVYAQSMSDEDVVGFVQTEQEKGASQQSIVSKLLQKGVTVEQLRRIRKKYEAEQKQPGAMDLTGSKNKNNGATRLRTNKEKAQDALQQKNGYMVRSQRSETEKPNRKEKNQMLNDEIGFMDIDSLIYYQNYFQEDGVKIFGHNIFNNQMLTFEPSMNMPTPSDYRLGAGDYVIIDVWGASQTTFEGSVSPDGTVTVEGVGPLNLAGMTVKEANNFVKKKLGQFYSNSSISLTVGETRSIQVQVMGEVNVPGTYTLSSLSSAFNALYAAGGINEIGTLRDIKVYRSGRQIATIDVYDYILNGNTSGNVRLADNDVIVVGAYDCLVNISGKVKRPMFYEMKSSESVGRIISYAGGFAGDAYRNSVSLVRKSGAEYTIHTVGEFEMNGFLLNDGDSISVDSVIPRFSNMVEVKGAVFHPGQFQVGGAISSVRDLIRVAEGVREDAFVNHAVMHRLRDDLTLEVVAVNVKGILDGTVADIPLRKGDALFIPSKLEMQGEQTVKVGGEVNYPGVYQFAHNTSLEDIVLQAGGLTDAASMAKVDVFRRVKDVGAQTASETLIETFSFPLHDGFVIDGGADFVLQPFDEIYVRRSPAYSEQQNVTVSGAVNFSGDYAMASMNYRLSDLIKACGGLSEYAYAKGARLIRKNTEEERRQRENTMKSSQIKLYEEAMQSSDKNYDLARADSLLALKMELGDTYLVSIDLERALAHPGSSDDVLLREGDELSIPQYSSIVKITGDVMSPSSVNYKDGESLNYYIKRAGGYTTRAKKSKIYAVYLNGSVKQLGRRTSKSIEPGCEIVVPTKEQRRSMTTGEILSIGSSTASIAAVIATLINVLK